MTEMQDRVDHLERVFELHLKYEAPYVPEQFRKALAFELAVLAVGA